ncbi:MAG: peptidoglycan DD-metalloendopeptidase family protein [Micrococcales bacterium]|nr:peptidoglycan DD-metalloendopeptidase family protein [Micrococcales bacterium]
MASFSSGPPGHGSAVVWVRRTASVVVLLVAVVAGSVCWQGATVAARADDLDNRRDTTQSQLDSARARQAELAASLEGLQGQVAATGQQLVELRGQLPAAEAAVAAAAAEAARTQREADLAAARLTGARRQQTSLTTTIANDTAQAAQIRAAVVRMARAADQGGSDLAELTVLLNATSAEDFVAGYAQTSTALDVQTRTLNQLDGLNAGNQAAANRLAAVETKIAELKATADSAAAVAASAQAEAETARAALAQLTAQVEVQQQSLEDQRADVEAQLAAADASAAQLSAELAAIIEQQRARPPAPAPAQPSSPRAAPQPKAPSGAVFANPTVHRPMVVTSRYGMRMQPVLKIYRLHAGIDLRSYCGELIYAGRAGTVQWAKYRNGFGNQVMIDHGWVNGASLMSSYSHLTRWSVRPGQHVDAGQVIGHAGTTGGVSTACHLHFEVYVAGKTVNPASYLGV